MRIPYKKPLLALTGVLCAAVLTVPVWASESAVMTQEAAQGVGTAQEAAQGVGTQAAQGVGTAQEAAQGVGTAQEAAQVTQADEVTETLLPDAVNLPDNDELFYGYLLRRAGVSVGAELMANAGSRLNAKDKELYDLLKDFIVKIADGTQTETVLTVVYNDFPDVLTAAELGVDSCFSAEGNAAIKAKVSECYNYDTNAVLNAILADFPYEMYWYDKSGNGVRFGYAGAAYTGTSQRVVVTSFPKLTVTMYASQDYGMRTSSTSYDPTHVDRSLHDGIDDVIDKAKSIVSQYRDESDYNKLLGYCKEICGLVEYHYDAVNYSWPYGDPWQLINVFDGDPGTDVVCEGYSKAFQYLCDLSAFDSPDLDCWLVTGKLDGGAGAGEHMWNVVTMDNGRRYLVDVTNSDGDDEEDFLFLKGGNFERVQDTYLDEEKVSHSYETLKYSFPDRGASFQYDIRALRTWGEEPLILDSADYSNPSAPDSVAAQIHGCSLTLVDDIALNFYLTFDDEAISGVANVGLHSAQTSGVQYVSPDSAFTGTLDGVDGTVYRFTVRLPAKRMNDKITLRCYDANQNRYGMLTPGGDVVTEFSYSVQDYLNKVSSGSTLKALAEAMSAYGYYAQQYFRYDALNAVTPSAFVSSQLSAVTADTLAPYAPVNSGAVAGLTAVGDSLTLDAAITQRCVFQLQGDISAYTFRLDGNPVTPAPYDSNSWSVEIPGLVAKGLDKTHTLTISRDGETFTHECSPLSYACKVLSASDSSQELQNLVRAMYLYHTKAKAYFGG